jgi:hypothetical protein
MIFLGGIAAVGWLSDTRNFTLAQIPWWSGPELIRYLLIACAVGFVFLALAVKRKAPSLFAVWTLLVFCVMVYAYFVSPSYQYRDLDHFKQALWLNAGATLAMLGGIGQARRAKKGHR